MLAPMLSPKIDACAAQTGVVKPPKCQQPCCAQRLTLGLQCRVRRGHVCRTPYLWGLLYDLKYLQSAKAHLM